MLRNGGQCPPANLRPVDEQGASVSTVSKVDGTGPGEADIFFGMLKAAQFNVQLTLLSLLLSYVWCEGASHVDKTNVAEDWLSDDQVSPMNLGGNGPNTRNEVCSQFTRVMPR
jgi:hypothetical protein